MRPEKWRGTQNFLQPNGEKMMQNLTNILIILLFITACSPSNVDDNTITIGAALPLTGIASIHGQNERQGIDLAVKEINRDGGIEGHPVKMIYEDDASNPSSSLTAIKKLIEVDDVKIIIGGTWDILANVAIPEIDKKKVILISPSALPDTITESSPYFFSVHSPVAINEKVFEQFLSNVKGKRVGAIVVNNPWGLAHLNAFKKAINATGETLVEERILQNFDNNDLSTELTRFTDQNLDAIFVTLNFNDMSTFAKKRNELGMMSIPVLAHSNFESSIEAGRIPPSLSKGVTIFRFSEPSKKFVETFKNEYGQSPEIYTDTGYDAVYAIKFAREKGGEGVQDMINGLHEINFSGASGIIYFGDKNYPGNKQPLLQEL